LPVNQLPLSLMAMKPSPLASSRRPEIPPKSRYFEVSTSPLRYCSEPKRRWVRSRVSKEGIGRASTSMETGALADGGAGTGTVCARAWAGNTALAAAAMRKRRRVSMGFDQSATTQQMPSW
jgi:hypothetical protein